jgi:hypothetical protein
MDRRLVAYWIATALFCAFLGFSGLAHSFRLGPIPESMSALGYPAYFMSILGAAKLMGVAALAVPGLPLVKEWAYAGFTFNLLGAAASHGASGDLITEILTPLGVLLLGAASYGLRPESRRLSASPQAGG